MRAQRVIPSVDMIKPAADSIELDYDERHRRRITMTSLSGKEFLLDLPTATAIGDGDGLALDDGSVIKVRAKAERVAEITTDTAEHLARIAWHLGNRHLPAEIHENKICIRDDHVITDMVRGLGATVVVVDAPFHPESGAYGHAHGH